jgi:hypothetical protein
MKNRSSLALGILTAIGLSTAAAHATPIVVLSGSEFAIAVDNLVVDGTVYNVTFGNTVDQTFKGNPIGALDAANALLAALNGSTAGNILFPGESANGFTIADDGLGNDGPTVGDPPGTEGNWSLNVFGPSAPFAEFADPPSVPEPSTWATMIIGLLGLGWMIYRQKTSHSMS